MSRPVQFHVGGTIYWVILTRDPDTMVLKDADSTPTVAIRKNGSSSGDSVTITKRSATTGIYDCSYNPASESEGDFFEFEESATVTGTTTASATYRNNWSCVALAVERGTDSAALASGVNVTQIAGASVSTSTAQIGVNVVNAGGTAWGSGAITANSIASDAITSAKIATDAIGAAQIAANAIGSSEIADGAITAAKIANDAITDAKVASDVTIASVTGSVGSVTSGVTVTTNNDKTDYALSTSGIAAIWDALTSGLTTASSIGKLLVDNINATISSRASQTSVDTIDDYVDTEIAAIKTVTDKLDTAMELDGAVYRFTTNALEQAPSGGGSTDWTSDERTAIRSILGIPSSGTTPDDPTSGILDTIRDKVDAVDDFVDTEVSAIKTVTDKLDTAMELDGLVYRFTTNALEQAPSGGGGGTTDWTSDERTAIRAILGIPGSGTTPADPTSGILDTIRDKIDTVDDFIDTEVAAIKAKTDNLPASPAATGDIPSASAIASQVRTELTTELGRIDVATSTRLASSSYTAPPTASDIRTAVGLAAANLDTQLGDIPTVSEFNERTIASADYATSSALVTVDTIVDAIKAKTDNLPNDPADASDIASSFSTVNTKLDAIDDYVDAEISAIKAVTDKVDGMLLLDGSVYQFTINALENAPSGGGGGGGTDWNADEKTAIKAILGIPDSGTIPADPTSGIMDTIRDLVITVDTVADRIEADTQDIQSRLPAALVSGRMDSSVGNMESNVITSSVIATGAITASAIQTNAITDDKLAASAITEIQSGLATTAQLTTVENKVDTIDDFVDTEVAAIKGVTDKLDTTVELDGAVYRFTTNALEQAPSGGGGGGTSIMVTPVVAQTPVRVVGSNIETFIGDLSDIRVGIFSGTDPVDLSGFGDLEVCVQERDGTDLDLVPMADITIDGDSNEYVTWTPNGPSVSQVRRGKWSLRKTSNKQVIGYGSWIVVDAALGDGS